MLRVLIVDDSDVRVQMIVDAIKSSEISSYVEVEVCGTADRARSAMLQFFDVLILDILIPKKDKGVAQALHSVNLLSDITDSKKKFIRPRLIMGVTADIAELKTYQENFLKVAAVVVDGSLSKLDWLDMVLEQLRGACDTIQKASRLTSDKVLISVHGIRTFGHWQRKLKQEMEKYSRSYQHFEVKYGFFDLVSFVTPALRQRKAKMAARRIVTIMADNPGKDIYIVAHSFGTLVVAEALKGQLENRLKRVIFCGSPMPHNADIDHVVSNSEYTINDCGTGDIVLVVARMLVLGLGDAGRVGFARENSVRFINRYHSGGHDLYFKEVGGESSFIERYWLPVLISDNEVEASDCRVNFIGEDMVDLGIKLVSVIKPLLYLAVPVIPLYLLVRAWI